MKRKYFIFWFVVSLFFIIGCGTEGNQWDEQINMGAYWHTELAFDAGTQQRIEFEIREGGAVDILFMDQDGFIEFQNRVGRDTVNEQTFDLPTETYGEYHMYVEEHDEYEFTFSWASDTITPAPVDVYVMNYNNFLLYQSLQTFDYYYRYDSTMSVNDIAVVTATEDLYFVIDNTSDHGAPPTGEAIYDFTICKLVPQSFTYFDNISELNTGSISYSIEVPDADTLFLVINNAGYVEDGAVPEGLVDFQISFSEE